MMRVMRDTVPDDESRGKQSLMMRVMRDTVPDDESHVIKPNIIPARSNLGCMSGGCSHLSFDLEMCV